jgi:hypothetical protein
VHPRRRRPSAPALCAWQLRSRAPPQRGCQSVGKPAGTARPCRRPPRIARRQPPGSACSSRWRALQRGKRSTQSKRVRQCARLSMIRLPPTSTQHSQAPSRRVSPSRGRRPGETATSPRSAAASLHAGRRPVSRRRSSSAVAGASGAPAVARASSSRGYSARNTCTRTRILWSSVEDSPQECSHSLPRTVRRPAQPITRLWPRTCSTATSDGSWYRALAS